VTAATPGSPPARVMWHLLEPYHAVAYFADEVRESLASAGMRGFWMGYFAGRAAPMGAVATGVVTATFYGFAPAMVSRAIPDAWGFAAPDRVWAAKVDGVRAALSRLLGDADVGVEEAARLAREAAGACQPHGRPLFAAYADLPWPDDPHLVLWQAATLVREHRGDGHVAALVAGGIDGCEAHALMVAAGRIRREALQPHRGWTDEEWDGALARLRARGWLDAVGAVTAAGREARAGVEALTDRLAAAPWDHLGAESTARLAALLAPLVERIDAAGVIPYPNPMGLPGRATGERG